MPLIGIKNFSVEKYLKLLHFYLQWMPASLVNTNIEILLSGNIFLNMVNSTLWKIWLTQLNRKHPFNMDLI